MSGGHGKEKSGKRNELLDIFQRLKMKNGSSVAKKGELVSMFSGTGMGFVWD